jgi:hypothetical protein
MEHVATTGLTGITGSGKTSLLSDYCLNVAELGGKIFTLPGYDIFTDATHQTKLSTQLSMGQLAKMTSTEEEAKGLFHSVVAIDQIESKLNHHRWQGVLPALYENFADQRRKLRAGIVYTLQIWKELLPSIQGRTFFLYELNDWHYGNPQFPKGENVNLTFIDVLGTKTGTRMSVHPFPWTYHPGDTWPFYDTNQWSNPLEQFRKMKIIAEPDIIDLDNLDGAVPNQKTKIPMLGGRYFECLQGKPEGMTATEIQRKYGVKINDLNVLIKEAHKAGIIDIRHGKRGTQILTLCT